MRANEMQFSIATVTWQAVTSIH